MIGLIVQKGFLKILISALAIMLLYWAINQISLRNIPNPYLVEITGENYEWHIRYAGKDGELYTADDFLGNQNLYLPKDVVVELRLKSADYLYFLELPEFKQLSLAVPDKKYKINFTPYKAGQSTLKGNQMCAYTHEKLLGTLTIYSAIRFAWWSNRNEKKND